MVLLLAGVSTLFLGASAAYLYTRFTTGVPAPWPSWLFYLNIPILFFASRMMREVKRYWHEMSDGAVKRKLQGVLVLTAVFIALQVIGWLTFFDAERSISTSQTLSFLFVLSGLHMLHVLGGLPFLISAILKFRRYRRELLPDGARFGRYLRSLALYWQFLDILWILLVVLLTASALFS